MKDEIKRYEDVPIKVFLGDKELFEDASSHKAKAFVASKIGEMLEYLRHQREELE